MASLTGSSQEQRRWLVVGIALHHILTPCLRDRIKAEMTPFYQHLVRSFGLDKQTYKSFKKNIPPSTVNLNYESINNNHSAPHRSHYDYCVRDEVSLAKLFMKPFMAKFNAFDSSFDSSAALAILCGALPFTSVKLLAENVRSEVRNKWAHCDFITWTQGHYDTCFDLLEALIKRLSLPPVDEAKALDSLKLWRTQGYWLFHEKKGKQRRALRIIFPNSSYQQALDQANLTSLADRRIFIYKKLMADMRNESHPISFLAPQVMTRSIPYQLRSGNTKTTTTMKRRKRANDSFTFRFS